MRVMPTATIVLLSTGFLASFIGLTGVTDAEAQSCVAAPVGLVSWWPGDGNANDIVYGNHGTLQNGTTFAAGLVGQAFTMDGVDDFVEIADSASLEPASQFTFDAWIMPTNVSGLHMLISETRCCDTFSYYITIADGMLRFNASGTGGFTDDNVLDSEAVIVSGVWQHVGIVYDGSQSVAERVTMFYNGAPITSAPTFGSIPASIADTAIPTLLGAYRLGLPLSFEGLIDEIEFYNRALTDSEVANIFNAGNAGKCKVLAVEIDIKPGSDPNCFNVSGHGVIPVAILGSGSLDVMDIDTSSPLFDGLKVRVRGNKGPQCAMEDSNSDSFLDLVCHFEDDPANWTGGNTTGTLTGNLLDGTPIEGTDSICIVP